MKIYDVHAHIFMDKMIPDAYEIGMARTMKLVLKNKHNMDMTEEEARNNLIKGMYDPGGERLLETMDKAGITKSVIFGADFGPELGDAEIHPYEVNKIYAEIAKKHPDKLIALAAIDPRRPGAMKHCEQCIEEWGMKGLKMHPAAGFYPTDEILYPFYEKCADWNVPIVYHTGGQPAAPVKLDTQRPHFIAEAATRFPDTKMIMAHAGMDLWNEAVMYGKLIPNVYFDLSYHQFSYVGWGAQKFYEWVRLLIDECGVRKIMWATDTPLPSAVLPAEEYVKVFTERDTSVPFTEEEIEIMMGGAAEEVFDLT